MKFRITWLNSGIVQTKELTNCKNKDGFFTFNSPIYQAIADETFFIDLGYGKHPFKVEMIKGTK
jgi:hypothetical protein